MNFKEKLELLTDNTLPYKWVPSGSSKAYNGQASIDCMLYAGYGDVRQVDTVLDKVFGGDWQCKYYQVGNATYCVISIKNDSGEWVSRSDTGDVDDRNTTPHKTLATDARKRAGVVWGIYRFLYSMEFVKLETKENKYNKKSPIDHRGNWIYSNEVNDYISNTVVPIRKHLKNDKWQVIGNEKDTDRLLQEIRGNHKNTPVTDKKEYIIQKDNDKKNDENWVILIKKLREQLYKLLRTDKVETIRKDKELQKIILETIVGKTIDKDISLELLQNKIVMLQSATTEEQIKIESQIIELIESPF